MEDLGAGREKGRRKVDVPADLIWVEGKPRRTRIFRCYKNFILKRERESLIMAGSEINETLSNKVFVFSRK